MGAGRPPKPTALKILAGNPGKRKLPKDEPIFTRLEDIANPFDEKKKPVQFKHWNRIAPDFLRNGLLNQVNRETLIHICELVGDIAVYTDKIDDEGHFVEYNVYAKATGEITGTVERENNATKPLREARLLHEKLLNEFGGNPSSASKVIAQKKPESKKAGNPFGFGIVRQAAG